MAEIRTRPGWSITVAVGLAVFVVGVLIVLVGLFVNSPAAQAASFNWGLVLVLIGAAVAAAGAIWRLVRARP